MTINLWHCVISFTSLALEGVHNRLGTFTVLTGLKPWEPGYEIEYMHIMVYHVPEMMEQYGNHKTI